MTNKVVVNNRSADRVVVVNNQSAQGTRVQSANLEAKIVVKNLSSGPKISVKNVMSDRIAVVKNTAPTINIRVRDIDGPHAPRIIVQHKGIQGPAGAGGGDKNYRHVQSVPATTWAVVHNLGKYASITVVDSGGSVVHGEILFVSMNAVTLQFSVPFAGEAYFN